MAGAGQFGRADQGIFSYWIHSWHGRRPLKYIGFNGCGAQVRDALHPRDLATLLREQMAAPSHTLQRIFNVAGGAPNSTSLSRLSDWCARRLGPHQVASDPASRRFDVPWLILDSSSARNAWNWSPSLSLDQILEEIAAHALQNPDWLDLTAS
jgi:CDP-paratose 2-epimerase